MEFNENYRKQSAASTLDLVNELRYFRDEFYIPIIKGWEEKIYFNGNSLGLIPKNASTTVNREIKNWAELAVKGHFEGENPWMLYHRKLAASMAPIVGALPEETVIMNTLTVNLHLMMVSFYRPTSKRFKIIMEDGAFPSDVYAAKSQARFHGFDPEQAVVFIQPKPGEDLISPEDIAETLAREGEAAALILIGVPNYLTGQVLDMGAITQMGRRYGCKVGFNLAHAAGNLLLDLHNLHCDFAVWCTYKYLNGGPGNLGGAFIHEDHHNNPDLNRLEGWWGNKDETRFLMGNDFDPIPGAEGWCLSNAPILSLAALEASLNLFEQAGMERLRSKSIRMTSYLEFLLEPLMGEQIRIITPSDPQQRGCQLSIQIKNGNKTIYNKLTERGVITDWREPNIIRAAPVPLYNTFEEIWQFANHLESILTPKT